MNTWLFPPLAISFPLMSPMNVSKERGARRILRAVLQWSHGIEPVDTLRKDGNKNNLNIMAFQRSFLMNLLLIELERKICGLERLEELSDRMRAGSIMERCWILKSVLMRRDAFFMGKQRVRCILF